MIGILAWWSKKRETDSSQEVAHDDLQLRAQAQLFAQQAATIAWQGEQILRLEGRIDELSRQLSQLMADNAKLVQERDDALRELEKRRA